MVLFTVVLYHSVMTSYIYCHILRMTPALWSLN